jgi:hypothetical protein
LLLTGVLMILLAQYVLSGPWNKLEVQARNSTSIAYLLVGLTLVLLSVLLYVVEYEDFASWTRCKLAKTNTGFKTQYKDSEMYVDFGVLEEIYSPADGSVVVLPANEFFDDRCLNDVHTAAGSFIRHFFDPSQTAILRSLIEKALEARNFENVVRRDKRSMRSFGTGTCVYLDRPSGTQHRIIFAAVATDREDTGLRTEIASVFQVMREIHRIIADERKISTIFIPLLGAGKGGVPAQLALRALMIAALEARCAQGGHAMKHVHVVVYKPKEGEPQVSVKRSRKAVRELVSLYREVSR